MKKNSIHLEVGDFLYQTIHSSPDFYSIINTCMTSTSLMFNIYKYDSEDILQAQEDYIDYYLKEKDRNIFLVKVKNNDELKYRVLNLQFFSVVLEINKPLYKIAMFNAKRDTPRITDWNELNNNFIDANYFQIKNAEEIYTLEEIKKIWTEWVRENFREIMQGYIPRTKDLLF